MVGIAWETGVLAGLRDGGADVTNADAFIGTSAGATVGAQVAAGRSLDALLATQLGPSDGRMEKLLADIDGAGAQAFFLWVAEQTAADTAFLKEVGRRALAAKTPTEAARLEMVESRLGFAEWPSRPLRVTAVDCETGELVAWDRDSGATLVQAVGSSSAVPCMFPPVTINGRRYYDGGLKSATCADLAVGHDRVVIVAPVGAANSGLGGGRIEADLQAEIAALEGKGAQVMRIHPDAAAIELFGPNLMDPQRRNGAAEAGRRQGAELASAVASLWSV